ncbi:hypothetical protein Sros01_35810 [Streptomyces roseochromogenus]|nr:hypothetical protein Sros01_35810 [Streptomyces roseochromogenus]
MLLSTRELQRRLTQTGSRVAAHAVHPGFDVVAQLSAGTAE